MLLNFSSILDINSLYLGGKVTGILKLTGILGVDVLGLTLGLEVG